MEQHPPRYLRAGFLGQDRGKSFSLPCGVGDCSAPPVSIRRLRSGPNLHAGYTHHCLNDLIARDGHRIRPATRWKRLVCSLRVRAPVAPGVETSMEQFVVDMGFLDAERAYGAVLRHLPWPVLRHLPWPVLRHAKRACFRWIPGALDCFKGAGEPHRTPALMAGFTAVPCASAARRPAGSLLAWGSFTGPWTRCKLVCGERHSLRRPAIDVSRRSASGVAGGVGGSSGVRTQDQRVKSPVLYQLS